MANLNASPFITYTSVFSFAHNRYNVIRRSRPQWVVLPPTSSADKQSVSHDFVVSKRFLFDLALFSCSRNAGAT